MAPACCGRSSRPQVGHVIAMGDVIEGDAQVAVERTPFLPTTHSNLDASGDLHDVCHEHEAMSQQLVLCPDHGVPHSCPVIQGHQHGIVLTSCLGNETVVDGPACQTTFGDEIQRTQIPA